MKRKVTISSAKVIIVLTAIFYLSISTKIMPPKKVLGSQENDTQVEKYIVKSKAVKKLGLKIAVKDFTDLVSLDRTTADDAFAKRLIKRLAKNSSVFKTDLTYNFKSGELNLN